MSTSSGKGKLSLYLKFHYSIRHLGIFKVINTSKRSGILYNIVLIFESDLFQVLFGRKVSWYVFIWYHKNEKINSKEHLLRSQIMLPNHSNKNNYDTGTKTDM